MEIIIDPRIKYNYASWFILGICRLFGRKSFHFDVGPFKFLPYNNYQEYNAGMAFILKYEGKVRKYFIDFEDVSMVFHKQYAWCDVYGMVNPTGEMMSKYKKMIALGPEFGVTIGKSISSFVLCLRNYCKGRAFSSIPFKYYIRDYLYTNIRRRRIEVYSPEKKVKENYVFHSSTLWYNNFAKTDTNYWRGEFLRACQKSGLEIEGGLFYIGENDSILKEMPDYPRYKEIYKDFIYTKRISMDDYITKTKKSVMVFNTPSVCGCHGWKLAEYLCMGKAIISTPLLRELPAPLVHGENIHFVSTTEELYEAVKRINSDAKYRQHLEQGARKYYEMWVAPEVEVKRLLNRYLQCH